MTKRVIVVGINGDGEPGYFACKIQCTQDELDNSSWGDKVIELAHYDGGLEGWNSKFSMIPISEDQDMFSIADDVLWSKMPEYDITEVTN